MLETIAEKLGKYVVGFVVLLLAFVFALQFGGPQAQGCTTGGSGKVLAADVYDSKITVGEFRSYQTLLGLDRQSADVRRANRLDEVVLNGLIDRALLAREAKELGFRISNEDALRRIIEKNTLYVTVSTDAPPSLPQGELGFDVKDDKGNFDEKLLKNRIQYQLRRSVNEFAKAQADEILAEHMRDVIRASVRVSPEEIWAEFADETDRANVDYVRFSPSHYLDKAELSDAEIGAWQAAHAEEVDKQYEAQKQRYTGLAKQVKARQIFFAFEGEDEAVKAAAKKKADAARAKAAAGADFASLAKNVSDDKDTKARGGDLGFTPKDRRPAPFDETVFALGEGQVSEVVEGPGGFYVFKAERFREGDVPVEEAKHEIAERLARDAKADALAKAAADKALAFLRAGNTFASLDRDLAGLRPLKDGEEAPADELDPRDELTNAPRSEETGSFGRTDSPISGVNAAPLVEAAFSMDEAAPLAGEPLKLGQDYVVYRLKERTLAKEEDFTDEAKARVADTLRRRKGEEAVKLHLFALRAAANKAGKLRIDVSAVLEAESNS
ncbi:MAG: peptidylprolyl isomerase [Myxococcales bacterium]|nr:peptidylprolyl isomerase [Myxococcales bacterium]